MKNIGLFFGSFNPIHVGHLIIANHFVQHSPLDEVWFVVSPQSPFKTKKSLLPDYQRLELVHIAVEDNPQLRPCDLEFHLPRPSYTCDTMAYMAEKYPGQTFSLIMGEDNLAGIEKWKNYRQLLQNHEIYVYPRVISAKTAPAPPQEVEDAVIHRVEAPLLQISASAIRADLKAGKDVRYLLTEKVYAHVDKMLYYRS